VPSIETRDLRNYALRGVSLSVRDGELFCLLGPNGSGKTTLLKAIAGLVRYEGSVLFDGKPVDEMPPEKRDIGYVPQSLALFTHMTVEENIAYGLKVRKLPKHVVQQRVEEALEMLGLMELRQRYPLTLSGGERQKVAIARALVVRPKVLLMDEPFTSLQQNVKQQLIQELKRLHRELGVTTIYVTHDLTEAEELGARIAVLSRGSLVAVGRFAEVVQAISQTLQDVNVLRGVIVSSMPGDLVEVRVGEVALLAPSDGNVVPGREAILTIPADKVAVYKERPPVGANTFRATVAKTDSRLGEAELLVGGLVIKAKVADSTQLREGETLYVKLPIKHVRLVA